MSWVLDKGRRIVARTFGALGEYNEHQITLTDEQWTLLQLDVHGYLLVTPAPGALWTVQGQHLQDEAIVNNADRPVEISYEAEEYTYPDAFDTNVPVSNDGDVIRPKASRFGVAWTTLAVEDGSARAVFTHGSTLRALDGGVPPVAYATTDFPGTRNPPAATNTDNAWGFIGVDLYGAEEIEQPYVNRAMNAQFLPLQNHRATLIASEHKATPSSRATSGDGYITDLISNDTGSLWVALDTNVVAAGTFYHLENAAHADGDMGAFVLAVRNDAAATSHAGTNGDYAPLAVNEYGALFTVPYPIPSATSFYHAEDAAHASGDVGAFALFVRQDTPANTATANGDYCGLGVDADGYVYERSKAYDTGTGANKAFEVAPLDSHYAPVDLSGSYTTTPLDYYIDCAGYGLFSLQCWVTTVAAAPTATYTISASLQDDGTAPASCTYTDVTMALFGAASITIPNIATGTDLRDIVLPRTWKYMKVTVSNGTANPTAFTFYLRKRSGSS